MSELSPQTAAQWLLRHNLPAADLQFAELGGGISNKVILAEGNGFRAVLKQSLGQLRTEQGWFSDRARVFREAAAMRWAAGPGIPEILFEDSPTFTIGMEAAPTAAEMWKTHLFRGEFDPAIARAAGAALGRMIAQSWQNPAAEKTFGDQAVFDELRLDPYYRFTAAACPDATAYIHDLIALSGARRVSLVHGDFSPKNLLVDNASVWVIDWEVVHYGDPSFDVAFLLNHLKLKSVAMPHHRMAIAELSRAFLNGLSTDLPSAAHWIVAAALGHLPALMLARVHGKSPAEYLDTTIRAKVARQAFDLMRNPPTSVDEVFAA